MHLTQERLTYVYKLGESLEYSFLSECYLLAIPDSSLLSSTVNNKWLRLRMNLGWALGNESIALARGIGANPECVQAPIGQMKPESDRLTD
jgi:hypothetical protein